MPERPKVATDLRARVRLRAQNRCEYCHASEEWQYVEFTMEHIVPVAAGGKTIAENLALCCFSCNRRKWDRRTGLDPAAGSQRVRQIRAADAALGRHPPPEDRRLS